MRHGQRRKDRASQHLAGPAVLIAVHDSPAGRCSFARRACRPQAVGVGRQAMPSAARPCPAPARACRGAGPRSGFRRGCGR